MKYSKIILLFILLFSIVGCDYVEEITIYHEPALNIYANVTAGDKSLNYIHVFRTTGYGEPDRYETDSIVYHEFFNSSSGDTIRYETLYIDTVFAVNKAEVYYIHNGDSLHFRERSKGIYVPKDTNYSIIIAEEYKLWVKTKDFGIATATETALAPVLWQEKKPLIISLSNPIDTLRWIPGAAAYKLFFHYLYVDEFWEWTYLFHDSETREAFWTYDSSDYDPIFNPDPFYSFIHGEWAEGDTLELDVSVMAYSDSYLDYQSLKNMQLSTGIIRYPSLSDFRVNINNALGAFTSVSISEERKVIFVP